MTDQPTVATPRWAGIRDGYREYVDGPAYFLDDPKGDVVFQPDVYPLAGFRALRTRARGIVDLGCGRAEKLAVIHARHRDWSFVGIDHGENAAWCRDHYGGGAFGPAWGEWIDADLDSPPALLDLVRRCDFAAWVVVCADVVEHLRDPRPLLATIRAWTPRAVVFSTPDRATTWGPDHLGPPPNLCHVREWSQGEFVTFLESQGFEIDEVDLTRADTLSPARTTTTIVARAA